MKRRQFIQFGAAGLGMMACGNCIYVNAAPNSDLEIDSAEFTHEASYYKKTLRGTQCQLCPHNCNVSSSRPGTCKTKELRNNLLVSTAYGNPNYVNIETPEKVSLYHFKPGIKMMAVGTAGCPLSCLYCKVFKISQKKPSEVTHQNLYPQQLVQQCIDKGIKAIAYSYTEPVAFFEYMLDTAKLAKSHGIKNIMVSNGYINEAPLIELSKYLDAAVIDVKAFNDATYQKLTTGSILPVLKTLQVLQKMKVWTEITHLLVPQWTDNFQQLAKMCDWMMKNGFESTPFHFNKFLPMNRLTLLPATPAASLQKAKETAKAAGLKFVYVDSVTAKGNQQTHCPKCKALLVERKEYKVVSNRLNSGKCPSCKTIIPGVW